MNWIERLAEWILRFRWVILAVTLLAVGGAASGLRFLTFGDDYRDYFSEDNPDRLAYEALQNTYSKPDSVFIVLAPKDGDVFTQRTLESIRWMTREGWKLPYATRVDSITNFQHTRADGDDLVVGDLFTGARVAPSTGQARGASPSTPLRGLEDQIPASPSAELAHVREIALSEPLLRNRLISPRAHVTAVNVTVSFPRKNINEVPEVMAAARRLVSDLKARDPNLSVHLTGMVTVNNAFWEHAQRDGMVLTPIMYGVVLLVTALTLRSLSGMAATLLVIVFSVLTSLGLAGWMGIKLTGASAAAPTVILTLAVADSIHILLSIFHGMRGGMEKRTAIVDSLKMNLGAVALTTLDTTIGFLMLNFSEVPPYHDLGNIVAMGILSAFLLSIFFLPVLTAVLPVRMRHATPTSDIAMSRLADFVIRRRRPITWGVALVAVVTISFVPRNEFNDDFFKYFSTATEFRRDTDFISANLTGVYAIDYSIESGESGGISDPAYLNRLEAFANWYRAQPEVAHVIALTDIMKRLNQNLHGDDPAWYKVPDTRELAAQYLLLYEMSLPFGLDLNDGINVDKSSSRVNALLHNVSSNQAVALDVRAQQWLRDHAPAAYQSRGTGPTLMFAEIGRRNTHSMIVGDLVGVTLISVIMIFALRSVKFGLLTLIPNLVPLGMSLGLWGLLVGRIGMDVAPVTAMSFGILVDDTIHNMSKYLYARRKLGKSPEEAIRYAFSTVGVAMVIASLILIAGFLVLTFSSFQFTSTMGLLTAMTIALALPAEFLLLPPLLLWVEGKTQSAKQPAAVGERGVLSSGGLE
jgi:predicted RND superfamily exporter protein